MPVQKAPQNQAIRNRSCAMLILVAAAFSIAARLEARGLGEAAFNRPVKLPRCGGLLHIQKLDKGRKLRVLASAVEKCSNLMLGGKKIKMQGVDGYYYWDQTHRRPGGRLEVLVHSNSKRTLDRLWFDYQDGPRPPHFGHRWKACSEAFRSSSLRSACQRLTFQIPDRFQASLAACKQSMSGPKTRWKCLELASKTRRPLALVRQCDQAFEGDRSELQCMRQAQSSNWPGQLIRACESLFDGDRRELQCIDQLASRPFPVGNSLRGCDKTFDGDFNEMKCVNLLSKSDRDLSEPIRRCDQRYAGDRRELLCLEDWIQDHRFRGS